MSEAQTPNTADGLTILDAFDEFYRNYYREDVLELANKYPSEQSSLTIEYDDLWRYDPDIADDWIAQPGKIQQHAEEALGQYDLPVDIDISGATVRLTDTEEALERKSVAGLTKDDIGNYVALSGQLNRVTDTIPRLSDGVFECQRCGTTTTIPQPRSSVQEPHECPGCERQGPFSLSVSASTWTDLRKVKLEEPPEEQVDTRGEHISVFAENDLVHVGGENGLPDRSGERVTILGELLVDEESMFSRPKTPEGEKYLDARAIVFDEADRGDVDVSGHMDAIEELQDRAGDGLIEDYRNSIAPDIMASGDEDLEIAMEALVAYLFNSYRADPEEKSSSKRGDIHIALIGDPGKGKSTILSQVASLSPKSEYRSGAGITKAGLTSAATQEEFFGQNEWTLQPGILPRANGGHCIIDEIDDVVDEKTKAIHDALEGEQMVKADKAGIQADLPTRTAVCVSGNPTDGRFARFEPIAEQVDMDPALISRMDALFAIEDEPDPDHDEDVAWHILDSYDELSRYEVAERVEGVDAPEDAETIDPPIPADVFRAAIVHAQDTVFPVLTEGAKSMLAEAYVDARGLNENDDDPVPATARTLEAGIRLATAFARAEFSEDVLPRHAERAIKISRHVVGLNFDPETGKFDAGMVDEGMTKAQKERITSIRELVKDLQPEDEGGADIDLVKERAEEIGIKEGKVDHEIDQLKQRGSLYEPVTGEVRTT